MSVLVRVRAQLATSETRVPTTTSTASTARVRAKRTGAAASVELSRRRHGCSLGRGSRRPCRVAGGHEVDQLLDPAEQRRLAVGVGRDPRQDLPPGAGEVGLVGVRPAQRLADAVLPLDVARDVGPGRRGRAAPASPRPRRRRRDGRRPARARRRGSGARRRRSGSPWSRAPGGRRGRRRVAAARARSRAGGPARSSTPPRCSTTTPSTPQVVAPDLLDQLGVVATLDEDPALAGHPGPPAGDGHRPRRRTTWGRRRRPGHRGGQHHRAALEQEARAEREGTAAAASVLQRQHLEVAVDRDDLAAPVGHDLLDDQPRAWPRPASPGLAPGRASRRRARRRSSGRESPRHARSRVRCAGSRRAASARTRRRLVLGLGLGGRRPDDDVPDASSSPDDGVLRASARAGVRGFLLEQVVGHVVASRLGKRVVVARLEVLGELVVADRQRTVRRRTARSWVSLGSSLTAGFVRPRPGPGVTPARV